MFIDHRLSEAWQLRRSVRLVCGFWSIILDMSLVRSLLVELFWRGYKHFAPTELLLVNAPVRLFEFR
jgi:hypothetical protein